MGKEGEHMAYNLGWSHKIVMEFWEKHREACEIVLKTWNITVACAGRWLSCEQNKWNDWKHLVKYVEQSYELTQKLYWNNEGLQKNYCTFVKYYKEHCKRIRYPSHTKQLDMFPEL